VDGEPILRKGLHFSYQREVLHMTDLEAMMRHWSEASDEALLEAAQRLDEFTDQGRSILLDEFRRRGLAVPARSTDADNGAPLALAEEIEVWRGNGMVQADPILAVLRANGIPARTRNASRWDCRRRARASCCSTSSSFAASCALAASPAETSRSRSTRNCSVASTAPCRMILRSISATRPCPASSS